MRRGCDFPVVRNLTHSPQLADGIRIPREIGDFGVAGCALEYQHVVGNRGAREPLLAWNDGEARFQRSQGRKIELVVAPLQHFHRLKGVRLQPLDEFRLEWPAAARRSESTVALRASGAARDLRHLGSR